MCVGVVLDWGLPRLMDVGAEGWSRARMVAEAKGRATDFSIAAIMARGDQGPDARSPPLTGNSTLTFILINFRYLQRITQPKIYLGKYHNTSARL